METLRVTRRRGVLSAIDGSDPALAIGDVAARHVRLTPAGVAAWLANTRAGFVPWVDVRGLSAEPPVTRWPHPVIGDSIGPILAGLAGEGASFLEPGETPTFPVVVRTDDDEHEWRVTQHHLSGYRRADAQVATVLVAYLVANPDARVLLARPTDLLDRVAAIARATPAIAEDGADR